MEKTLQSLYQGSFDIPGNLLMVFAKNPDTQPVKTRLAQDVGQVKAKEVYLDLLAHTLSLCRPPAEFASVILVEGSSDHDLFAGLTCRPQVQGDLGARLLAAFSQGFASGFQRVLAIGSDCPVMTKDVIYRACKALDSVDCVVQPACDGGYTLLGLRMQVPALFIDMPFSTMGLYSATRQRLLAGGYSLFEMEMSYDIDTLEDYLRWQGTL